jgi:hypothetical protein
VARALLNCSARLLRKPAQNFENKKPFLLSKFMEMPPMKIKLLLVMLCLVVFTPNLFAQTSIKLFDATPIDTRDSSLLMGFDYSVSFGTKEIFLSCPVGAQSTISGPGNGNFIVDNYLSINNVNICPGGAEASCFNGTFNDPGQFLGEIMEVSYNGIAPVDVSSQITGSGNFVFNVKDISWTFGSTEVYLNTTCSTVSQVCHRDSGRRVSKTLSVGGSAVAAHLSHGDTEGPCEQ